MLSSLLNPPPTTLPLLQSYKNPYTSKHLHFRAEDGDSVVLRQLGFYVGVYNKSNIKTSEVRRKLKVSDDNDLNSEFDLLELSIIDQIIKLRFKIRQV